MPAVFQALLAFAVVAGLPAWRAWRRGVWERETAARLPRGIGGIIVGAEAVRLGHGGRGVLLLHGFGDTPQSMRGLAESLHAVGWTVRVPLLPGHGRSLRDFARARATDWLDGARSALTELRSECGPVSVVGQSMGGALTTILSATPRSVDAMVLLAPYLQMSPVAARLARLHVVGALLSPYLRSGSEASILDPEARRAALGFGLTTPRLLRELRIIVRRARVAAPAARVPTLVLHSVRDPRIRPADAESCFGRLGGQPKVLRWLDRSGHVLSADRDRDVVAAEVVEWLGRYTGSPDAGDRPAHGAV